MVEELQLSDQDVTTVADMIDAQILALVPDWKPGALFEDMTPETGFLDQDRCLSDLLGKKLEDEFGGDATSLEECCMSNVLNTQDFGLSGHVSSGNDESPARGEGTMYGRFEDITYNQGGSDYSPSSSGVAAPISSIAFDHQALEDSLLHVANQALPDCDHVEVDHSAAAHETKRVIVAVSDANSGDECGTAFNDLVESQRSAGYSKYTHQTWEVIMNMDKPGLEGHNACAKAEMHRTEKDFHSPIPWVSSASTMVTPDLTEGEEEIDEEMRILAVEKEKELLVLRKKHELAVLETKSPWGKESGFTLSFKPPHGSLCNDNVCRWTDCGNFLKPCLNKHEAANACAVSDFASHGSASPATDWEVQLATVRESFSSRKSADSDRLSVEELSAMNKPFIEEDTGQNSASQLLFSRTTDVAETVNSSNIHLGLSVTEPADSPREFSCVVENKLVGEKQMCVYQETDLEIVPMASVGENCATSSNSCPVESHKIETISLKMAKVQLTLASEAEKDTTKSQTVVNMRTPLRDPKIHSDEYLSGNISIAMLDSLDLKPLDSPNSDISKAKAVVKDIPEVIPESSIKPAKMLCQTARISGSQLQISALPVSVCPDRTGQLCVASSVSGKQENSDFYAKLHARSNKSQELDASKCNVEKSSLQPEIQEISERTGTSFLERCGHEAFSSAISMSTEEKRCTKQGSEKQEALHRTPVNFDGSLDLKKEQLQRSIALLEAKTLEGLHIGLVANPGSKRLGCSPSIQPPGSTTSSQVGLNSASEASKR